mmetsp:Transcript_39356/g.78882  ORF Transcript_39356/g.78882 Transcript_39356/m.78882 type:complete len:204 (-) Transcript_39356:182-793(-)
MTKDFSFFMIFLILLFNEKNTPEILPYDFSLIRFFWEICSYQNDLVNGPIRKKKSLLEEIKRVEIDKFNFIMKAYHRYRIWKIEKEVEEKKENLLYSRYTSEEKSYADTYKLICVNFQSRLFFDFIPEGLIKNNIKKVDFKGLNTQKNIGHIMVFFRVLKKKKFVKENILKVKDPWYFYGDSVYCMKYNSIKRLIISGVICLQ